MTVPRWGGVISVFVVALGSSAGLSNKATYPKKLKSQENSVHRHVVQVGNVSGRVFLITKGGDLKPARIARVHLMWADGRDSAFGKYLDEWVARSKQGSEQLKGDSSSSPESLCITFLLDHHKAFLHTLEWAKAQKKVDQVLATTADEEGRFTFAGVPIGHYYLFADGYAGMYQAYWRSDEDLEVTSGSSTDVKLPSPKTACTAMQ